MQSIASETVLSGLYMLAGKNFVPLYSIYVGLGALEADLRPVVWRIGIIVRSRRFVMTRVLEEGLLAPCGSTYIVANYGVTRWLISKLLRRTRRLASSLATTFYAE